MPFHTHDSTRLYWQVDGEGPASHVLIHGLGLDRGMWFAVAPALAVEERVLTVDLPGHGAVRADDDAGHGALTVEALAAALHAIMAAAAMPRAHVCGQDLGAAVALQLALTQPDWVSGLTLIDPPSGQLLSRLAASGPADQLSAAARARGGPATAYLGELGPVDTSGWHQLPGTSAHALAHLETPTTLIVSAGAANAFEGEPHTVLETAGGPYTSLESPQLLIKHLLERTSAARSPTDRGQTRRREVLGNAWVDRSLANRTEFNADFQDMIARVAWDEIWTRPGLDDRTRRLLVIAITAALGRWDEFRLHVRAGLEQRGFSVSELKEVLMQTGIYAGVPAANTGFAHAAGIVEELAEEHDR